MEMQNDYLNVLARGQFEDTPKAVFAAIAISFAMQCLQEGSDEERFEKAARMIHHEWSTLHQNGIVPQKPLKLRKEARNG